MAAQATPAGADLLNEVEKLAGEGHGRREIAERLGFRNASTFNSRLVKASQCTGRPVPAFASPGRTRSRRVDVVQVKPRARGESFGVNIPREPLERLGVKPGDRLTVTVRHRRVVLSVEGQEEASARTPRGPRLIKRRGRTSEAGERDQATG